MGLFDVDSVRKNLPKGDKNAMFLLWQIEQIYDACPKMVSSNPSTPEQCLFSTDMLIFFIEMSVHNPQLLEEFLYSEPDLSDLFEWATNLMRGNTG